MKKTSIIILITLLFIANISIVEAGSIEDNLEELKQKYNNISSNVFLSSHPVGSIYETTSVDESTAAKMKAKYGGTWEVYGAGQTLVGVNSSDSDYNTVNKTGGSKTRSLAVGNLPAHNHSIPALSGTAASAGGHTHTLTPSGTVSSTFKGTAGTTSNNGAHTHTFSGTSSSNGAHTHTYSGTTSSNGDHSHGVSTNAQFTVANGSGSGISGIPAGVSAWGNYAPAHWYTISINNAGAHTHTFSGTTSSNGAHTHTYSGTTSSNGGHTHTLTPTGSVTSTFKGTAGTTSSNGAHTHTVTTTASTTGNQGSGTAFSTVDPYITVYRYKRTQ